MPRVLRSAAALAGLACAVAVSACGSGDDKTKSSVSARATRSAPPPQTAPQAPPPRAMPMRTTQTIQAASGASNRPKTTLKVTVTRLLRGLHPNDFQFGGSRKGLRFVGVRISFKNIGQATWTGTPSDDTVLITSSDTQANMLVGAGNCGGSFARKVELLPGERQRGCLPFVLKRTQSPKLFQFSPDSPATPPVEWTLRR